MTSYGDHIHSKTQEEKHNHPTLVYTLIFILLLPLILALQGLVRISDSALSASLYC